jgi:hypothetical protein
MPIRNLKPQSNQNSLELKAALVNEMRNETSTGPLILKEDAGFPAKSLHVFVVWDDWRGSTQKERSEVVMDAFEEVYGQAEAQRITVAMGLTEEEADKIIPQWRTPPRDVT